MFEGPSTPVNEYESTSIPIPADTSMNIIEAVVEDVPGRVNVVNGILYRDMPECVCKAAISGIWGRLYGNFLASNNLYSAGGTAGTLYASGNLLSPDFCVWNLNDPNRHQNPAALEHLMQPGAAPNWILEFEWHSELYKERKGVRKVLDGFFTEVGTNASRVNEAWVFVKHQNVDLHNTPPEPSAILKVMRWLSYVPYFGLIFLCFLTILDIVTGTQTWTGRTFRHDNPPADPAIPYIIIFFREHDVQRYGFYWLHWHECFAAPEPSLYFRATPVSVNPFLEMMRGRV